MRNSFPWFFRLGKQGSGSGSGHGSGGSGWPLPSVPCVGNSATWSSYYGNCSDYFRTSSSGGLFQYCSIDRDDAMNGFSADQVCSSCGRCFGAGSGGSGTGPGSRSGSSGSGGSYPGVLSSLPCVSLRKLRLFGFGIRALFQCWQWPLCSCPMLPDFAVVCSAETVSSQAERD